MKDGSRVRERWGLGKGLWEELVRCMIARVVWITGAQQCDEIFTDGKGVVSAAVLSSVQNDVQKLVDCAGSQGELEFQASLDVELKELVVLSQPIVVKGGGEGKKRPVFTCSEEGVPAFEIV